ncbi:MAG: nitrous oxide-stimulated promoter family protein [candidate division KSB1 bacterium]|nr:nitrous oxide-stimulated promoter family protein [candidate division KSB1 bacterium]
MGDVRVRREEKTVAAMIHLYCAGVHWTWQGLCCQCTELLAYARQRLARCPFGADKPTCAKCAVHCYRPEMRARIRAVMRYAGPRMLFRHPVLAFFHLVHTLRPVAELWQAVDYPAPGAGQADE